MRTQWTTKGNQDAGSSCPCDWGLHRYLRNFGGGGGGLNPPNQPPWYATTHNILTYGSRSEASRSRTNHTIQHIKLLSKAKRRSVTTTILLVLFNSIVFSSRWAQQPQSNLMQLHAPMVSFSTSLHVPTTLCFTILNHCWNVFATSSRISVNKHISNASEHTTSRNSWHSRLPCLILNPCKKQYK